MYHDHIHKHAFHPAQFIDTLTREKDNKCHEVAIKVYFLQRQQRDKRNNIHILQKYVHF